jgi:hypothetical protein
MSMVHGFISTQVSLNIKYPTSVDFAFEPAFGALACLLPEYTHISKDLASADSVTTDGTYIRIFYTTY